MKNALTFWGGDSFQKSSERPQSLEHARAVRRSSGTLAKATK
jgi:hypothetical protein